MEDYDDFDVTEIASTATTSSPLQYGSYSRGYPLHSKPREKKLIELASRVHRSLAEVPSKT